MLALPQFPVDLARLLCRGAASAYDTELPPESIWPGAKVSWVRSPLATAAVVKTDNLQFVLCRGTADIEDWAVDLSAAQTDSACCRGSLHSGFAASAGSVYLGIKSALEKQTPIYLTGHSKGAAEATIIAAGLASAGFNVAGLFTFGSPRVCNPAAASTFPNSFPTWRIVDSDDLVPHLPFPETVIGWRVYVYRHVGTFVHLRADGTIAVGENAWEELKQDALAIMRARGCIRSHFIDRYERALAAA